MESRNKKGGAIEHYAPASAERRSPSVGEVTAAHGSPQTIGTEGNGSGEPIVTTVDELEASKKGRFAYFKTRDFYIVLVLGYFHISLEFDIHSLTAHMQSSPCTVHHFYQYLLLLTRRTRHIDSGLPDLLQLRLTQHHLHRFHPLPLRLQALVSSHSKGWMEVHYLVLSRCRG